MLDKLPVLQEPSAGLQKLPLLLKRGSMKAAPQSDAAEACPIVLPGQDLGLEKPRALQESVELAHWNATDNFPPGMPLLCPLKKCFTLS